MCLENTVKRFEEEHLFFWRDCDCVEISHLDPVIQFQYSSQFKADRN